MKLVKTSVVACVLSALFASQVLAQDLSTDAKSRGGMQGKGIQGGMGDDDEDSTAQLGAADRKAGMKPLKSTKGAAGTTGIAPNKGATDDSSVGGTPTAGKRH
ncbi:hypothetical protein JJC00_09215 [Bradyrhizobium diazoefficiens]|uniref:hypothetical protein n=1 Tax=Bradyrhizobium diazoefficiens TaxID=1355477 RepID=UPI00190AC8AD|nr:hypothetical protein [Bradyrhizobium diazoefficiens]QQO35730.1 hypothetical protein JJC00_09215 [Bradyrhizobium diazoefficiens]